MQYQLEERTKDLQEQIESCNSKVSVVVFRVAPRMLERFFLGDRSFEWRRNSSNIYSDSCEGLRGTVAVTSQQI